MHAKFVYTGKKVPHFVCASCVARVNFWRAVESTIGLRMNCTSNVPICRIAPPLTVNACSNRYEKKKLDAFGKFWAKIEGADAMLSANCWKTVVIPDEIL